MNRKDKLESFLSEKVSVLKECIGLTRGEISQFAGIDARVLDEIISYAERNGMPVEFGTIYHGTEQRLLRVGKIKSLAGG
jgi:hypothetical protein